MATEYTTNYNLKKPDTEAFYDVGDQNGNMDILDAALKPEADPSQVPTGNVGKLVQWVSWLANRIKAITGAAHWYDDPPISLTEANNLISTKAAKSTSVNKTLLAVSWTGASAPYSYSLAVAGVTTTSNQEILPTTDITEAQLEELQAANIIDGGQAAETITLKAWGDKPTIDLPIRVILRGDA